MTRLSIYRALYTLFFTFLLPVITLRLLWRGLLDRGYWQHVSERFGFYRAPADHRPVIWLHAVSVGEVRTARRFVEILLVRYPWARVLLTVTTPSGRCTAETLFSDQVEVRYIPYDLPFILNRFLKELRPHLLFVLETEFWPNLFCVCRRRSIPVILLSARMTAQSARRRRLFLPLIREMLCTVTKIAAQSKEDKERLIALGGKCPTIDVLGNLKLDVHIDPNLPEQAHALKEKYGLDTNRPVWIAASIHPGEESFLFEAALHLKKQFKRITRQAPLLILAPRHPVSSRKIFQQCARRTGFSSCYRSALGQKKVPSLDTVDALVVDTLGELCLFYAMADVAFVGGSLIPVGGHNLLEPAALGLPIVIGPHHFNQAEIVARLSRLGNCQIVTNAQDLGDAIYCLLNDEKLRRERGQAGAEFVRCSRGVADRTLEFVAPWLPPSGSAGMIKAQIPHEVSQ